MTVKKKITIYFILQLPQMKTTFVDKSQKVNLQGNMYTPYFAFLFFVYFLSTYFF